MPFVELNRDFVPIRKGEEPNLELGSVWGRRVGGWLRWDELLKRRRIVLLAEASSGKTEEFRQQVEQLRAGGHTAVYVRIEELADSGLRAALDLDGERDLESWLAGTATGWFFLDSIDEARLNRKSFEVALKHFARELGATLERASIFISCRVTDWRGDDDRALIARWLPAWESPKKPDVDERAALLDPIFSKKDTLTRRESTQQTSTELLVVQLAGLSLGQYSLFATAAGISDAQAFVNAINRTGLASLAERPGDLLALVEYWNAHGRFGSLAEMVENGVSRKLAELDPYRPDNQALSSSKARQGAERIAAALTLCKSFTLRAPSYDPDPSLAFGALDPAVILPEWSEAERNALLRRGIFAPATYGRVRFHHRSTQEYLAACWLDALMQRSCPKSTIWDLLFVDRYGVETVVPSLRPAVAWLCLRHPDICQETIRREPLTLIRNGDPGSLSLDVRRKLLSVYAAKQSASEISDDYIDSRSLWMFADRRLSDTIRSIWAENRDANFRLDLLRLIGEGAIRECVDLATSVARDDSADDYNRIAAIQAMKACEAHTELRAIARKLMRRPESVNTTIASAYAVALYPRHLTTAALLRLISKARPSRRHSTQGFGPALSQLYAAADDVSRAPLLSGLAELCLTPPFIDQHRRMSSTYAELATELYEIACHEAERATGDAIAPHLVPLLMAVERADRPSRLREDAQRLEKIVRSNEALNRALLWGDVDEQRLNGAAGDRKPIRHWQVWTSSNGHFWGFSERSISWLYQDVSDRTDENERRIALSALVTTLQELKRLGPSLPIIRARIRTDAALLGDLRGYLAPPAEDNTVRMYRISAEKREKERDKQALKDKASWIRFQRRLNSDPGILSNPANLKSWSKGVFRLYSLTKWLMGRTGAQTEDAAREWRLLEEGFSRRVAESYRDGMKALWRVTKPRRPRQSPDGRVHIKWQTILSFAGLGLEAAENPDWALHLTSKEAKLATQHGCFSEQGYPPWIEQLATSHPSVALPIMTREIRFEWLATTGSGASFLPRYSTFGAIILRPLQTVLVDLICQHEAGHLQTLDRGVDIVRNLDLNRPQKAKLIQIACERYPVHLAAQDQSRALHYLSMFLLLDIDSAIETLHTWLRDAPVDARQSRAEVTLGTLFERRNALLGAALETAKISTLEKLLHMAYMFVRPEDDAVHEGAYSPDVRDHAEQARSELLNALLRRTGADAYRALRRAAANPIFVNRKGRFLELAHGKAEQDAELPAWKVAEVLSFERLQVAPAKTGDDLLRILVGVLHDIALALKKADASSRALIERAADEDEVQHWLSEQISFRAKERFHVHREAQVARGDKPDIVVSSTSAQCEVAVEVKHGGMGWTAGQLHDSLQNQLANDYLKPYSRRHGVLVITHHKDRQWLKPKSRNPMTFQDLIGWLSTLADTMVENENGAITVKCVGIDTTKSAERTARPKTQADDKHGRHLRPKSAKPLHRKRTVVR